MTIKNGSMTIQNDAMKTGITIEEVTVSILFQNSGTLKSNHTNYEVVKCIFIQACLDKSKKNFKHLIWSHFTNSNEIVVVFRILYKDNSFLMANFIDSYRNAPWHYFKSRIKFIKATENKCHFTF